MTNLFTNLSKNGSEPVNGPRMDRHNIENGPMKMRKICAVLVMLLCLGVGNAWGGQYSYTCSNNNNWVTTSGGSTKVSYASSFSTKKYYTDGTAWSGSGSSNCSLNSSGYFILGKSGAYLVLPTYSGEKITSVVLHGSNNHSTSVSVNIFTTSGSTASTAQTWSTKNVDHTYKIKSSCQESALKIQVTNAYNTQFTSITINTEAACGGTQLDVPDVTTIPSSGQVQLSWPAVSNASKYQVSWNGGDFADATSPYTKSSLSNGTAYTWAVKAIGNGSTYCSSEINEGKTKPNSTIYTVTWKVNGVTYATTKVANGDHLVLPASPSSCSDGKVFAGWSASTISGTTDTKPTFVSSQTTISANKTYHAVFATKTANSYTKGDINDLFPGQIVLIVNVSNNKALSDEYVSNYADERLKPVGVTISSNTITSMSNNHLIWTVENRGLKYNFKTANGYLRAEETGQDKLSCYSGADSWSLTANSGKYYMNSTNSGTSRIQYNGTYFTTYGNNSSGTGYEMTFFVPTLSAYFTTCCSPLASINGSVSWSNGSKATLVWDKDANATGYVVKWKTHAGAEGTYATTNVSSINDTLTNKKTCAIPSLTAGTEYDFKIFITGKTSPTVYCDKDSVMTAKAPKITVKSAPVALTGSDYAEGVSGGGTVKTFTVSGVGLTGALTFTAPTNFQVSTDNGSTWSTSGGSKTLAASGTLAETTIKARLVEGLSVGTYGGATTYITISGGGAAAVNSSVSITGTVSSACTAPTVATPTLTSIASGTITVSCASITVDDNCDLSEYGFVWKASSDPTASDNKNAIATTYADNFSKALSISFTTGNTYKIKAFGTNSAGTTLSSTLTVTPQSVAFNMNGHGSQVATQYVNNGSKASEPSAPSASYYTFNGWKLSGSAYNFSTATVTSDITLDADWSVIPVTALTLNYSTLKRYVGESDVTLSVSSVTPNTANPAVTWSSSDATVASVDGGVVSFLKAGTATITATSTVSGAITATCSVEVRSVSPTMQDEDGTTISGSGLSATWTVGTRTLTASEGTSKYKFKRWIVTNATPGSTTNLSTTLGDPTGNVTVVAEFYKPRTVTKGTGTGTSTFTVSPTGEVKYGTSVTVTCAATDGYKNPWTLTVTPSDGATYDASGSTTSITISSITKDITVDLAYVDKGCTTHAAASIIGNTSNTSYSYGPVNNFYKYSARQILYKRDDLNFSASTKKGTIKSISFQYAYGTAMTKKTNVKIYMANTPLDALATDSYVPFEDFTEVYSGALNFSSGWNEIELTTDFKYNGLGNLAVLIDDNSNQYDGSSYIFYYHAATGAQIHGYYDSGDLDPSDVSSWNNLAAISYRPNTKFCIQESDIVEATVNWYVNGEKVATETDYEGTALSSEPTPVSGDCDGSKVFVGWYDDNYTHATDAPAFVTPKVIPEGGADYYAVFANSATSSKTFEATIQRSHMPVSYGGTLSNVTATETGGGSGTFSVSLSGSNVMQGTGGNDTKIQFRKTSDGAGTIYNTTDLGTINSVTTNNDDIKYYVNSTENPSSAGSGGYFRVYNNVDVARYSSSVVVNFTKTITIYSNYATSCCTQRTITLASSGSVTGGTFNSGGVAKACATRSITLTATPSNSGYVFNGWTVEDGSSNNVTTTVLGSGHESDNPATMTMPDYNVTVTAAFSAISSISVKMAPTKTVYLEGETFDPTGLVITATYANSATVDVPYSGNEASFTFSPTTATTLTTSNTAVTITYSGQTVNQSITVYSVTMQALDEQGNAIAVGGPGSPTFTAATRAISPAADAANYKFWKWTISGASLGKDATIKGNSITNPTGNVTVTAVYYLPRTVTWLVNGEEWTPSSGSGTDGTAVVTRGVAWSTLTLPTDPDPLNDEGCGQKFMGWVAAPITGELDKDDDAAAITALDIMTSANQSTKTGAGHNVNNDITFYAVFADYVE